MCSPQTVRQQLRQGEVIATGSGKTLKVGDLVLFDQCAGTEVVIDDDEYLIMWEEEVIAVIDPEPEV